MVGITKYIYNVKSKLKWRKTKTDKDEQSCLAFMSVMTKEYKFLMSIKIESISIKREKKVESLCFYHSIYFIFLGRWGTYIGKELLDCQIWKENPWNVSFWEWESEVRYLWILFLASCLVPWNFQVTMYRLSYLIL